MKLWNAIRVIEASQEGTKIPTHQSCSLQGKRTAVTIYNEHQENQSSTKLELKVHRTTRITEWSMY